MTDAGEADLLQMLWRWDRYQLWQENHVALASTEDVAKFLSYMVDDIHFHRMTAEDFSIHVAGKNILHSKKEVEYFCYFSMPKSKRMKRE